MCHKEPTHHQPTKWAKYMEEINEASMLTKWEWAKGRKREEKAVQLGNSKLAISFLNNGCHHRRPERATREKSEKKNYQLNWIELNHHERRVLEVFEYSSQAMLSFGEHAQPATWWFNMENYSWNKCLTTQHNITLNGHNLKCNLSSTSSCVDCSLSSSAIFTVHFFCMSHNFNNCLFSSWYSNMFRFLCFLLWIE